MKPMRPMSPPTPTDQLRQLREAFVELRLPNMLSQFEIELQDETPDRWLERLFRIVDAQLRGRRERAIERRIKAANFPAQHTLDDFNFKFQTGVDRDQIMQLATLDWLTKHNSILFSGMSGTGKSHLSIALGQLACVNGYSVRYTTSANMLSRLHIALATNNLQQHLGPLVRCDLLIIDEVGLDLAERKAYKADDASLFYRVIAARYEASRSCIITTNIEYDKWGLYLGDDVASAAILDRLAHHSYSINISGPSWRAKEHTRLNKSQSTDKAGE